VEAAADECAVGALLKGILKGLSLPTARNGEPSEDIDSADIDAVYAEEGEGIEGKEGVMATRVRSCAMTSGWVKQGGL
jgi:hypothetical protein